MSIDPNSMSKRVRYRKRLLLSALALSVLCISSAKQAVAAESANSTVRIQSAAGYSGFLDNKINASTRSSEGYVNGRGRSTSTPGNRQSREKKNRFKKRKVIRTGALFTGFGSGYIGLDATSLTIDNSTDNDINPRGLRLRLGTQIDDVFDLELHLGGGRESENTAMDRFSATYLGAFVKGHLPLGRRSAVFGLAGFSGVGISQRIGEDEFSDSRGGFSFGFGLETNLSNRIDLSGDFVRYVGEDGELAAISAVNVGIKLYF